MTSTGALRRAFAAAKPPNPPPTITTRGVLPELELLFAIFGFGSHPFSSFRAPRFHKFLRFVRRLKRSGSIANLRPAMKGTAGSNPALSTLNIKDLRDLLGRLFSYCLNNSENTPGI